MNSKFEMLAFDTVIKNDIEYSNPQDIIKVANFIEVFSENQKSFIKDPLLKISKVIKDTSVSKIKPYVLTNDDKPYFGAYRKDGGIYWNSGIFDRIPPQNQLEFLSSFLYCAGLNLVQHKKDIYESEIFNIGNIWSSILFVYFGYEYGIKLDVLKIEKFSALIKLFTYYNYTKRTDLKNYLYIVIAKSQFKELKINDLQFIEDDFSSITNFLKLLETNGLTDNLTLGRFSSKLLGSLGIMGLKAFETYEYFVPWIMAAALPNKYISTNLFKNNKESFNRLLETYFTTISRVSLSDVVNIKDV